MNIMVFLVVLALLGTVASLFAGNLSMARGGKFDDDHSEAFMESRLVFQGIALLLILIASLLW